MPIFRPIYRFWLAVLCGYLSVGATLQVLPGFIIQRFYSDPFIIATAIGVASLAAWIDNFSGSLNIVWLLIIILPAIGFALVATIPVSAQTLKSSSQPHRVLMPKGAMLPGFAFFLTSYGYGSINALLILYLIKENLGGQGIVLSLFATAFLITRIVGSPLVSRFGGRNVLFISILIEIGGLSLITTHSLSAILIGTVLTGCGVAMLYPSFVSIVVQRVPSAQHGVAVGFMTSFWDLGLVAAGIMGGWIVSIAGFSVAFWVSALLAMLVFLMVLISISKGMQKTLNL